LSEVKIGFFGGSFDPVHFGHLCAAQDACEHQRLDRLLFVPAAQAPLKRHRARSSARDRLAMLRAAIGDDARFGISDFELKKGGVSYTIDSVRFYCAQFPRDQLFWVVGGDQLGRLHLWKDIRQLAQMIEFIVLERPGHLSKPASPVPGLRLHRCPGHAMEISSTELRDRARRRLRLDYFMPGKTVAYIKRRALYCRSS
jgi:nicotinate-nucleotide adenylyltransferase